MGMYTELNIGVALVKDVPKDVVDILNYMLDGGSEVKTPEHPFFYTSRWRMLFTCDCYYFDGRADSSMEYDNIDHMYHLNVRSSLKNYDDEIEKFLSFIEPYLDTDGFLGYMRYEECDDPTLIYNTVNGIEYKRVN